MEVSEQETAIKEFLAKQQSERETLLSGLLTLLVYRMGGRVSITRGEMNTIFATLTRKEQVITIQQHPKFMILELSKNAVPPSKEGE